MSSIGSLLTSDTDTLGGGGGAGADGGGGGGGAPPFEGSDVAEAS